MAWDGNGNFTRTDGTLTGPAICQTQASTGVDIQAVRFDNELNNLAEGLEKCLTVTGETTPTANQPMGGFKHLAVADATAATDYVAAGQIAKGALLWGGISGGTANAQTIAPPIAPSAYTAGMVLYFRAGATNTGATTLNVSGLGAQDLVKENGDALNAGDLVLNRLYGVIYTGSSFVLQDIRTALLTASGVAWSVDPVSGALVGQASNSSHIIMRGGLGVNANVDNESLYLTGGTTATALVSGAGGLQVYGSAHATKAGGWELWSSGFVVLSCISGAMKSATIAVTSQPVAGAVLPVSIDTNTGLLGYDSSTRATKENINNLSQSTLEQALNLQGVTYSPKTNPSLTTIGLIAEDVNPICPQLVAKRENGDLVGVNYNGVAVLALELVKQLNAKVQELEARILTLEQR